MIGSALAPLLAGEGHQVVRLSHVHGPEHSPQPSWDPEAGRIALGAAGAMDAVIHLAGENIAQRWTPAAKARIRNSRVNGTKLLSEALVALPQAPKIFLSASATGYYGDRGEEILNEQSVPGIGFLAEVCRDWEAATEPASALGIRVVNLRLGIVLAPRGGALGKMLPAFRLGLGGRFGRGLQYWSWIALDDLLSIIRHLLLNTQIKGPVNAVSPHPVRNLEFTRTLGSVLRRPAFFHVPAFVLRFLLGEMGENALLASGRVRPERLEQSGFAFQFPELEGALRRVLGRVSAV